MSLKKEIKISYPSLSIVNRENRENAFPSNDVMLYTEAALSATPMRDVFRRTAVERIMRMFALRASRNCPSEAILPYPLFIFLLFLSKHYTAKLGHHPVYK